MKYIRTKNEIYENKPLEKHLGRRQGKVYKTHYVGYDEFHTYYSLEYLTATHKYEILQIVEVKK